MTGVSGGYLAGRYHALDVRRAVIMPWMSSGPLSCPGCPAGRYHALDVQRAVIMPWTSDGPLSCPGCPAGRYHALDVRRAVIMPWMSPGRYHALEVLVLPAPSTVPTSGGFRQVVVVFAYRCSMDVRPC
ncbi:hypothetical protein NDU88_000959 [Pleurodeles waltl]|uniref:Uncharacterized protein n=1 Tax=Pleurodeles waltl TaxID=8319 RepID=A0AAV7U7Z0_PLEWA|nr:hypothetical protein NDU88_000959 [Pleurodeles waltl]